MALLPFTICAQMLGIHPKTLHHWLKEANVPFALHPSDARIKCVESQHLLEVAKLHDRSLPELSASREEQARFLPAEPEQPSSSLPTIRASEPDVMQKLSCLEAKVVSLQEHLAQLALALLHERERTLESRMTALETLTAELLGKPVVPLQVAAPTLSPAAVPQTLGQTLRPPNPAEKRVRPLLPLIEYGTGGAYVIMCPREGELLLTPNSTEWFAWLASLSSFRFVGKDGRLSASRVSDHGPKRTWFAYRYSHQHTYKHYLGTTDSLTIDHLEHMAAKLQSHMASL